MDAKSCCFVSHTLEDGVGPADANRLLAAEIAKRGWRVSLCGLNDSRSQTVREEEMEMFGMRLPVMHIPQALDWSDRCQAFGDFLERQQPGHVIFRFIPYSLNPKGVVWSAANSLPRVLRKVKVLWLMDEVWVGEGSRDIKEWLVGRLQRFCMLRLLRGVKPLRVFTNNRRNTSILRRYGVDAETLRLFGNVPVLEADRGEWLFRELQNAGVAITHDNRDQWLVIGNFGAFLPDWKPDSFFSRLKERAEACGMRVCFVGIGGLGASDGFWREVAGRWGRNFHFTHLGRRDAGEISRFLQSVDYGITTTPYFLVGKSGTCMAMLDHGLPILVPRIADEDDPTEFPADMVLRCGDEIGEAVFSRKDASKPNPQLTRTADELIGAMSAVG